MTYPRHSITLALLVSAGCGPAVSGGQGPTDTGTGETAAGSSGESGTTSTTGPKATSSTSGADPSTDGGSTGTQPQTQWCWESQWAQASGVSQLWSDGNTALAAAGRNYLVHDGTSWSEHTLDLTDLDGGFLDLQGVRAVAARSIDDAWFGGYDVMVHLEQGVASRVELPIDHAEVLAIDIDDGGSMWTLLHDESECPFGGCQDIDGRLFQRNGSQWIERSDSAWVDHLDIVGTTMWGVGNGGQIALANDGGDWEFIETDVGSEALGIVAISPTELWIAHPSGTLRHWREGAWQTHLLSPWQWRGWGVDATGVAWMLVEDYANTGDFMLRRFEANAWVDVHSVPPSRGLVTVSSDEVLLAISGDRNAIARVSNIGDAPTVTDEFWRESLGRMQIIVAPRAGAAAGLGLANVQRFEGQAWTKLPTGDSRFGSLWGTQPSHLWAIEGFSGSLSRVTDDTIMPWPLPIEDPRLVQVWGTADDRAFVVGAPRHSGSGINSSLLVMRWDGDSWSDVSPEIDNPGSRDRFSLHGTPEHLYVVTPGSLHHYDGARWESVVSPSFDYELVQVRVESTDNVFVLDSDENLRVHDGTTWQLASAVWPELAGLTGWTALHGNETAGIYAQYADDEGDQGVMFFDGTGWIELELPAGVRWRPTVAVSEDGLELWIDDELRLWRAIRC